MLDGQTLILFERFLHGFKDAAYVASASLAVIVRTISLHNSSYGLEIVMVYGQSTRASLPRVVRSSSTPLANMFFLRWI